MKQNVSLAVFGVSIIFLIGISIFSREKSKEAQSLQIASLAKAPAGSVPAQVKGLTPEQQFRQYIKFEREMRLFLREYASMSQAEATKRAQGLMQQVNEREERRHISAGEAMQLKTALINAMEPDEQVRALKVAELMAAYRTKAEQRQAQFAQQQRNDPMFKAYKEREAQIVAEVQGMRTFPNGMSRDEYLRQRLLEARAAIYYAPRNSAPTSPPAPTRP